MVGADQGQPDAGGIPSGNQQAFTPSVEVANDGTIGVTYYDFRNNTADPSTLPTDYFAVHCHPTTATACTVALNWGNEVRLTNAPFDMLDAPFAGGFFTGDYEGLAATADFLAFFSQPHGSNPSSAFLSGRRRAVAPPVAGRFGAPPPRPPSRLSLVGGRSVCGQDIPEHWPRRAARSLTRYGVPRSARRRSCSSLRCSRRRRLGLGTPTSSSVSTTRCANYDESAANAAQGAREQTPLAGTVPHAGPGEPLSGVARDEKVGAWRALLAVGG